MTAEGGVRRRLAPRLGVRARAALVSATVVGVVLIAATFAFVAITRGRIESSIGDAAAARADAVAALVAADALANPIPGGDPELFAQVVDGAGTVVASDRLIAGVGAFAEPNPAVGQRTETRVDTLLDDADAEEEPLDDLLDEGPYVVIAEGVDLDEGPGAVLVAASLEDASEALGAATPVLVLGVPILVLVVGAVTWVLTGRALRPVDEMRSEAERISAAALDRRLPVPEARDELRSLAGTLNEMLARLEASVVRQRRFVADASHELKSPLAALRAIVDVTDRAGGPVDEAELVEDLRTEIDRMQRLVDDLLYLARYDEQRPAGPAVEVDLGAVVRAEAASVARRSSVAFDDSGVGSASVSGDPDRLLQLVRNLADNAARHASSQVWLETSVDGSAVTLRVSDDGPGIPSEDRERIFDRFVRLDESRTRATGGTGLGLAVARAIARSHGGDVRVVEPLRGGATIEATLPALRSPAGG